MPWPKPDVKKTEQLASSVAAAIRRTSRLQPVARKQAKSSPPKWRKRRCQQPPKSTSKIGTTNRRKLAGNNPRAIEATRKSRQEGGENTRASKKSEALHISILNGRSRCGLVDADLEDEGTGGVSQVERVGWKG